MSKRSNSFGDVEFYQAKKEIKQRFDKILVDLQETVKRNGYAVVTVKRFRGCLDIQRLADISILPYYSKTYFATKCNKIQCVLSLISYTMQLYWRFCAGNRLLASDIDSYLHQLENIVKQGLKNFKVEKSQYFGKYFLGEIQ